MTATESPTIHNTFVLERNFPQRPSRVFSAFAQPALKRRWYVDIEQDIRDFHMDFRVGGVERFRYGFKEGHPIAGSEIANESIYQDIVDEKRIVMTSRMSLNGKPIVVMLATFEFVPAEKGTDLILTHQGTYIDWPDGVKMIEMGWSQLIDRLQNELAQ
ncbi:MAG: SRPBCC domain-containing protein [Terracidiphilus sp.]